MGGPAARCRAALLPCPLCGLLHKQVQAVARRGEYAERKARESTLVFPNPAPPPLLQQPGSRVILPVGVLRSLEAGRAWREGV